MYFVKAVNPAEAWLKATRIICEEGFYGGGWKWKNILHLATEIENPLEDNPQIVEVLAKHIGEKWTEVKFYMDILEGKVVGNRFVGEYEWILRNNNRFNYLIYRIKKTPLLDQCCVSLLDKDRDIVFQRPPIWNMPCLTFLNFTYRQGKLNLFATFRTQDFGRKAYGNYKWLGYLLDEVCKRTGKQMGVVVCVTCSVFIRDKEQQKVENVLRELKECLK